MPELNSSHGRSRPLRVFMVSYLYDPGIRGGMGGFQKVLELAAEFSRRHDVTVFAPSYSRRSAQSETTHLQSETTNQQHEAANQQSETGNRQLGFFWIPVIDQPLLRLLTFNLLLIPAVIYRSLRGRPDVIYQRIFNAVTPPLLARLLGAKLVVEFNGNPLQFYKTAGKSRGRWVRRLVGWNLRCADKIVSLTEGLKSEIRADFDVDNSRTIVAPSGSNSRVFYPLPQAECRSRLGIPRDVRLAVFTGTFFTYQGVDVLLEALADPRLESLQTWLVGDGQMRSAWEARAAALGLKNFRFTGQVDYHQVPVILGAADFCLAPFNPDRGEVSPLKVMDYLFCGRPTVISDIPSVRNLIEQFPSLMSFQAGDPRALANALCRMLEQRENYLTLAAVDSKKARLEFSWEQIALKIESDCF